MGLCLPEGHPQAGEIFFFFIFIIQLQLSAFSSIFIFTKIRNHKGLGLPQGQGFRSAVQMCGSKHRGRKPQWDLARDLLEPEHTDSGREQTGREGPQAGLAPLWDDFDHKSGLHSK